MVGALHTPPKEAESAYIFLGMEISCLKGLTAPWSDPHSVGFDLWHNFFLYSPSDRLCADWG